jgi:hypothetical protein
MPKAFKIYPKHPAVAFLANLHADLGGRIQANRKEGERLAGDMKHVEAVIRMFDADYNVRAISVRRRNRSNRWFKRGAMFRAVLDVLKAAEGPLTVREIVLRVLAGKGEASPGRRHPVHSGPEGRQDRPERWAGHAVALDCRPIGRFHGFTTGRQIGILPERALRGRFEITDALIWSHCDAPQ